MSTTTISFNDMPPPTQEELDTYEAEATKWCLEANAKLEAEWRQRLQCVAFIDQKPAFVTACNFDIIAGLEDPQHARVRIIRLVLKGGGQIRVMEKFSGHDFHSAAELLNCDQCHAAFRYGRRLQIKAHTPDGIVTTSGKIDSHHSDMQMDAVVLPAKHQAIAERVAETLRLIDGPDTFRALLDGSSGCAFCGRALRDHVSRLLGYGPDCAKGYGLPHDKAAADVILAKRRTLLED